MRFFLVISLVGLCSSVFASPLNVDAIESAAICKGVSFLSSYFTSASCATSYCSSFLSIKTKTVTNTITSFTTSSISTSTTAAQVATVTDPKKTETSFVATTIVDSTVKTNIIATSTSYTSTTEVTSIATVNSYTPVCYAPSKRAVAKRAASCSLSAQLRVFPSSLISAGCTCLMLSTPTVTASITSTSTASTTIVFTITNYVTITPTDTTTKTDTSYSTSTSISSVTAISYLVSTITRTSVTTAIVENEICDDDPHEGQRQSLGITGNGLAGHAIRSNNVPDAYTYGIMSEGGTNDVVHFSIHSPFIQVTDFASGALTNNWLYVQDPINGGVGYIGSLAHIYENDYWRLPCSASTPAGDTALTCYNKNLVPFVSQFKRFDGLDRIVYSLDLSPGFTRVDQYFLYGITDK